MVPSKTGALHAKNPAMRNRDDTKRLGHGRIGLLFPLVGINRCLGPSLQSIPSFFPKKHMPCSTTTRAYIVGRLCDV